MRQRDRDVCMRVAARHKSPEEISDALIQECDCAGFAKGNSIWFDSQDLYEEGYTACPSCKKPFERAEDAV